MREIKFRAYDSLNESWAYWSVGQLWSDYQDRVYGRIALSGEKFYQYTGFKDKNGTEIYEGDMVRILYTDWPSQTDHSVPIEEYKKSISKIGVIVWFYDRWSIKIENTHGASYNTVSPGKHGEIEVIGNIHQNPELVQKEKV